MSSALEGIKVVDVSQVAAAPVAARHLADFGADVIHVESTVTGDFWRGYQSGHGGTVGITSEINYNWENYNRNKRSITINLAQESGRTVVHKLIENADVFITNMRPFELDRFELDYSTLERLNPMIIYASINGYGKKGTDKDSPAYDITAYWTRAGVPYAMTNTGMPNPTFRPAFGDNLAGMTLAFGIMAALFVREKTGIGQEVDVSLYHTGIYQLSFDYAAALATRQDFKEEMIKRRGEAGRVVSPEREQIMAEAEAAVARLSESTRGTLPNSLTISYTTKDERRILLQMLQPDRYFPRFCRAIGQEQLIQDPRFNSFETRRENSPELTQILDEVFKSKTLEEWKPCLGDIPCAPAQTIMEVIDDPQARENDFFTSFDHPTYGPLEVISNPAKLSKTPASVRMPAPELGQHTEEILLEYGYTWEDIIQFKEQGIIA
ncbi:MAG: CoA transferase [Dehalococcoidales bacterium]|nr:MAG: CoA transferase [Dehalococcoidales bacterium]